MRSSKRQRPIRVLVAKPGLDGHDRGALIVAQGLRDAGMEVIYTGLRQSPEQIVAAAIQEDVDCIGLSSLSGAHMSLFPAVMVELRRQDAEDILVIGGGVIPAQDARELQEHGIARVFTPGSTIAEMAAYIRERIETTGDAGVGTAAQWIVGVDHIAMAVRSVTDASVLYRDQLGFLVSEPEEVVAQGVRVVFAEAGNTRLELLEPLSDASPLTRFLEKRGPGLHHVAYRVTDIEACLDLARAQGLRLIDERPRPGAHGMLVAFLHPSSTGGVLTEYCQPTRTASASDVFKPFTDEQKGSL